MLDSVPQPDLSVRILSEYGGQGWLEGELAAGAPEFIGEVDPECSKIALYERAGVQEYLLVTVEDRRLEWRVLRHGRYTPLQPDSEGEYTTEAFPGLLISEPAFCYLDPRVIRSV